MERRNDITPRELALVHEALQNQILNTRSILEDHIEQNDVRFKNLDDILFHPTTGLTYRVYGAERSVRGACLLIKWFSGIASALIVVLLVYIAGQFSDLLKAREQVLRLLDQVKQEQLKR